MQKTMDGYLFPIMNQFELKYFKLSDFFKYFFFFQKGWWLDSTDTYSSAAFLWREL